MRILKFEVEKQVLKSDSNCDFSHIVAGTKGYLETRFCFSEEWTGCRIAAVFFNYRSTEYPRPIINGRCKVPDEVTDKTKWKVRIVGEKEGLRITTNSVEVRQT